MPKDPQEEKSYAFTFFVLSMLLLFGTVWTVADEVWVRRPWKKYQHEFNQLELSMVEDQLQLAWEDIDSSQLKESDQQIQDAEAALKSKEFKQAVSMQKKAGYAYEDKRQELQFLKSEIDEAYYFYKHAQHQKHDAEKYKTKLDALQANFDSLQVKVNELEQAHIQATQKVNTFHDAVKTLKRERSALLKDVDRLEAKRDAIKARTYQIKQVVVPGLHKNEFGLMTDQVDRCASCHLGINKAGFEEVAQPFTTHPRRQEIFKNHPPDQLGCFSCHQGQGAAIESVKQAHGEIRLWEYPLLRDEAVESSCNSCHYQQFYVKEAEVFNRGKELFTSRGCFGCHLTEGFEKIEKVGPSLARIGAKVEADWIYNNVQDPSRYSKSAKMPSFYLSNDEATAVTAYLIKISKDQFTVAATSKNPPAGNSKRGYETINEVGCLGCHVVDGKGVGFGPELSNANQKLKREWVYQWVLNPRHYDAGTSMPSMRLSQREAADVTAFLTSRGKKQVIPGLQEKLADEAFTEEAAQQGLKIISARACYACHDIPGTEKLQKIGIELSTFGHKREAEMDFGDTKVNPAYVKAYKHKGKDEHVSWANWTYNKVKNPDIYNTERFHSLMPNFRFSDRDARDLVVWLRSLSGHHVPASYAVKKPKALLEGAHVVRRYNCRGCHVIDDMGGTIRELYEDASQAPPILKAEGAKVQAAWFFNFLHKVEPIRPWLKVRMPSFQMSNQEADKLVQYFMAQDGVKQHYTRVTRDQLDPAMVEAGRKLASEDYFNCLSCHIQGGKTPGGDPSSWAPDFGVAHKRLRPEWIKDWIHDPQKYQPGTRMPSFYFDEYSGPDDILDGDEDKQMEALTQYILSLGIN